MSVTPGVAAGTGVAPSPERTGSAVTCGLLDAVLATGFTPLLFATLVPTSRVAAAVVAAAVVRADEVLPPEAAGAAVAVEFFPAAPEGVAGTVTRFTVVTTGTGGNFAFGPAALDAVAGALARFAVVATGADGGFAPLAGA